MEKPKDVLLNPDARPYCLDETPAMRARIEADLKTIVSRVLETFSQVAVVKSIALVGGFGRGEGGVVIGEGGPRPINDYDILIIIEPASIFTRRKINKRLASLMHELEGALGITVDLDARNPEELARVPNLIVWYEIKEGSRLLWGATNPKDIMPAFDPARLPLVGGTRLLFNRASGLLSVKPFLLRKNFDSPEAKIHFLIQVSKSALALGDCLLLRTGKYCVSYEERARRMNEVNLDGVPDGNTVVAKYKEAVEMKVRPNFEPLMSGNFQEMFDAAVAQHEIFMRWWEEQRLGRKFSSWLEYTKAVPVKLPVSPSKLRTFAGNLKRFGPSLCPAEIRRCTLPLTERLFDAMPLLLFEPTPDNVRRAAKILRFKPSASDATERLAQTIDRYAKLWH